MGLSAAVLEDTGTARRLDLRVGGICALAGAVVFAVARVNHGDPPAADARATLDYLAHRPTYAAVHLVAVVAALVGLAGLASLGASFTRPGAWLLGRVGVMTALAGFSVFAVESTAEGLALPTLAAEAASRSDADRRGLVATADAVAQTTHGPSLVGVALMVGLPLVLLGLAMALDAYPSWLGWVGVGVGAVTTLAAGALFLSPDVVPGFLLYGVLASVLAQAWLAATGVVMLRRSREGLR